MVEDEATPGAAENRVANEAAASIVEGTAVLTRQRYVTFVILLLTHWVTRGFLLPLAWAAVLAIAEWPLYRRAISRYPKHGELLLIGFSLVTALLAVLPISLVSVPVAQESQTAIGWVKQVQVTRLAEPSWLGSLPLVGFCTDQFWRDNIGSPQAASSSLGGLSASSLLSWTQSIAGEFAHATLLFLTTLVALSALLSRSWPGASQRGGWRRPAASTPYSRTD